MLIKRARVLAGVYRRRGFRGLASALQSGRDYYREPAVMAGDKVTPPILNWFWSRVSRPGRFMTTSTISTA